MRFAVKSFGLILSRNQLHPEVGMHLFHTHTHTSPIPPALTNTHIATGGRAVIT